MAYGLWFMATRRCALTAEEAHGAYCLVHGAWLSSNTGINQLNIYEGEEKEERSKVDIEQWEYPRLLIARHQMT